MHREKIKFIDLRVNKKKRKFQKKGQKKPGLCGVGVALHRGEYLTLSDMVDTGTVHHHPDAAGELFRCDK